MLFLNNVRAEVTVTVHAISLCIKQLWTVTVTYIAPGTTLLDDCELLDYMLIQYMLANTSFGGRQPIDNDLYFL